MRKRSRNRSISIFPIMNWPSNTCWTSCGYWAICWLRRIACGLTAQWNISGAFWKTGWNRPDVGRLDKIFKRKLKENPPLKAGKIKRVAGTPPNHQLSFQSFSFRLTFTLRLSSFHWLKAAGLVQSIIQATVPWIISGLYFSLMLCTKYLLFFY